MARFSSFLTASRRLGYACALCSAPALAAQALDLALPRGAQTQITASDPLARYALPIGVYANGVVPSRVVEGAVTRSVWQIPQMASTTSNVFSDIQDQLIAQGFQVDFRCQDQQCGGFDFRFGIETVQAPDMFVDLSNFWFASLSQGTDQSISLLVSAAAATGYIQLIQVGPQTAEVETSQSAQSSAVQGVVSSNLSVGEKLRQSGAAVLDDLEYPTGASQLSDQPFASLAALADWLNATPSARVFLVGHTDAEGTLDGNVALSKKRAESVMARLIDSYGVNPDQLAAHGVGFLAPRATNETAQGRTTNRRVEVVLVTP